MITILEKWVNGSWHFVSNTFMNITMCVIYPNYLEFNQRVLKCLAFGLGSQLQPSFPPSSHRCVSESETHCSQPCMRWCFRRIQIENPGFDSSDNTPTSSWFRLEFKGGRLLRSVHDEFGLGLHLQAFCASRDARLTSGVILVLHAYLASQIDRWIDRPVYV